MEKRQILNIINFVRAVEPRVQGRDMLLAIKEQLKLMNKHSLRGTFLLQYDALIRPEFTDIFSSLNKEQYEIGVWFEIVQPQVEAIGLEWTGRYPWDWYTHCGFSVGYTKEQREKLIDVLYEKFKSIFGYYPRVFGSWLYDTHTLRYIEEKYGADAFCLCKEQYGTDGYTLWGGYYGQGYFPNKTNYFFPAKTKENQINIPIFRMLGSDPVYQYDCKLDINREQVTGQHVVSLEAVYPGSSADKNWVDWYLKENFSGECLSFGYAQAGQENAFGWERMANGITLQFPIFAQLRDEGKIELLQLGETGKWYKEAYKETPASAIVAHSAFDDKSKNSVWYCTKNYRINLYGENGALRIRDIHIFTENLVDPYENNVSTGQAAYYDTLPFIDGSRFTGKGILSGGFLNYTDGTPLSSENIKFTDNNNGTATVEYSSVTVFLTENGFKISAEKPFSLEIRKGINGGQNVQQKLANRKELSLEFNGCRYSVILIEGIFENETTINSQNSELEITFKS